MLAKFGCSQLTKFLGPQDLPYQDNFLLKFLYWLFHLAWGIHSGITEWVSNCIYSTQACKDEVLGNSVIHNNAWDWPDCFPGMRCHWLFQLKLGTSFFCTTFSGRITCRVVETTAFRVYTDSVSVVPLKIFPE